MKYAHLADLHLGSWRDPKMRDLSTEAFLRAMDSCISNQVDFIIFAGDIFNTSLPSLDILKIVTKKLKEISDKNIPIYTIAGSHDFSPSGKTMIDVLENAGLVKNICKGSIDPETKLLHLHFTTDLKTGAKLTGILGRKGQLDQKYYQNLSLESLEQETGYKIFVFHTTIAEMLPTHLGKIEAQPASFLPKHFNYYAGGHIHHPTKIELPGYKALTYPGALFPNSFSEVEYYGHGGYYLITTDSSNHEEQSIDWIPIKVKDHLTLTLDCNHKSPEVITYEIADYFQKQDVQDKIITIHLKGTIDRGKVSDINFQEIITQLYQRGAYFVMKNSAKLISEEFEHIKMAESTPEQIEEKTIQEHLQQVNTFDKETEIQLIKSLLALLATAKTEGETVPDFHKRIEEEINHVLNLQL